MQRLRGIVVLGAAAVLAVVLVACGGQKPQASGGQTGGGSTAIAIEATEFQFSPKEVSASAGTKLIELRNKGSVEHDFVVDALGIKVHTGPGQVQSSSVELKPGKYEFYCSIPGHKEAGMVGTLTVS